ncbi:hypothetical protein [Bordetella genomosp. 9]|uniref:Uncharacterized protein n=1 Tax=Bordetella genomosp. 9 TaxID=1416803 RepID=A0A1W6Z047_9BORD|nr:hypothetical protein [Bordetella genomosp. 9]ARP86696.1 hypothetical protein CAL13_11100 [Bordetella genomosp. 9]
MARRLDRATAQDALAAGGVSAVTAKSSGLRIGQWLRRCVAFSFIHRPISNDKVWQFGVIVSLHIHTKYFGQDYMILKNRRR